jgi:hypothetical protein
MPIGLRHAGDAISSSRDRVDPRSRLPRLVGEVRGQPPLGLHQ